MDGVGLSNRVVPFTEMGRLREDEHISGRGGTIGSVSAP